MEQSLLTEESHFKMSKKIAQLTRVIGMLVNKNEEQEYEKQYLSEVSFLRPRYETPSTEIMYTNSRRLRWSSERL